MTSIRKLSLGLLGALMVITAVSSVAVNATGQRRYEHKCDYAQHDHDCDSEWGNTSRHEETKRTLDCKDEKTTVTPKKKDHKDHAVRTEIKAKEVSEKMEVLPETLPNTGAGTATLGLLAIGSTITAGKQWLVSRKGLKQSLTS